MKYFVKDLFVFILASSMDKEMVNILASLADDDPASQRVALSQSILLDEGQQEEFTNLD